MTDDTTAGYRRTFATSIDATRTQFSVATPGGFGILDLYQSTRVKLK